MKNLKELKWVKEETYIKCAQKKRMKTQLHRYPVEDVKKQMADLDRSPYNVNPTVIKS